MKLTELILERLSQGGECSGEAIAKEAGVSRAAVWKAIGRLNREGYLIEATSGHGYRLRASEALVPEKIAEILSHPVQLEVHGTVASTNLEAVRFEGEHPGCDALIIADAQTAGQGRLGRSFISKSNTGLYMTLLLHPIIEADSATALTVLAAVATARVLEREAAFSPGIKWVNDLLWQGKKLAGILTKGSVDVESGMLSYVTVGIGINVCRAELDPSIRDIATSVEEASGVVLDRGRLAALITNELLDLMPLLGSLEIADEYKRRSVMIGKEIRVIKPDREYDAVVKDIDSRCRLILELEGGDGEVLATGDVSIRSKPTTSAKL